MTTEEAVKLWKKLRIQNCTMDFSCGGDSMGYTSFSFFNDKGDVSCQELADYFDIEVYQHVTFYETSDGYYQGESGTVEITLNDEGDDFEYYKSAQSECTESHTSTTEIELSPKMIEFIKENVSNINGGEYGIAINFKREFIMTDEQEALQEELEQKLLNEISSYQPDDLDVVFDDWFMFTTNNEGEELSFNGNRLIVSVTKSYIYFIDSE
ncbi:MAG: hypothetical protein KatS3mg035_1043 [Bacteroidia bacterium]|nr:MAG: hypothetical protein KatS3mg035_1043 [Bacteroidia bacterium]